MALLLSLIIALNFICIAFAYDPTPLQDHCVADLTSKTVRVNGWACKDPKTVTVDDFRFRGLHMPGDQFGSTAFKTVDVETFPALNTQGLSLLRFDLFNNNSVIAPHTHPRAAEVIFVTQGSVEAGFVSGPQQYNIKLTVGDVFVFPNALVHYFRNIATGKSVVMAVFNSQKPGFAAVPQKIYGV